MNIGVFALLVVVILAPIALIGWGKESTRGKRIDTKTAQYKIKIDYIEL